MPEEKEIKKIAYGLTSEDYMSAYMWENVARYRLIGYIRRNPKNTHPDKRLRQKLQKNGLYIYEDRQHEEEGCAQYRWMEDEWDQICRKLSGNKRGPA